MHAKRPSQLLEDTDPWQKPETQSNLAENLSFFDEIHDIECSEDSERKTHAWNGKYTEFNVTAIQV